MKDNISIRAYSKRPWYTKRVAKMPVGALIALLLVSGIVAAVYVSKQLNSSAPQAIQGVTLTFAAGTDPGATPNVPLNTVQVSTLMAQGVNGYVTPIKLQVVIGSSSASDTCASLATKMNDGAASPTSGKIATAVYPGGATYVTLDIVSGTSAVAFGFVGGCAMPLTVSTYTPTGTAANAWNVRWAFYDFPAGSITYGFVAST